MNKFLISAIAAFGLTFAAHAQSQVSASFINGYNLYVTATSTNTYGGTNVYSQGYTVTNSATYPYTSAYSPTYVTNTAAIQDVALWANRDGSTPYANISVGVVGDTAAFTNTLTFVFAAIPAQSKSATYKAITLPVATAAANKFSFAVTGNGTTPVCLSTNIDRTAFQGSAGIRLLSVTMANAGTTGHITGVWLNGFKPPGAE